MLKKTTARGEHVLICINDESARETSMSSVAFISVAPYLTPEEKLTYIGLASIANYANLCATQARINGYYQLSRQIGFHWKSIVYALRHLESIKFIRRETHQRKSKRVVTIAFSSDMIEEAIKVMAKTPYETALRGFYNRKAKYKHFNSLPDPAKSLEHTLNERRCPRKRSKSKR